MILFSYNIGLCAKCILSAGSMCAHVDTSKVCIYVLCVRICLYV